MSTQTLATNTETISRTIVPGGDDPPDPVQHENPQHIRDTFDITLGRAPGGPDGPGGPGRPEAQTILMEDHTNQQLFLPTTSSPSSPPEILSRLEYPPYSSMETEPEPTLSSGNSEST